MPLLETVAMPPGGGAGCCLRGTVPSRSPQGPGQATAEPVQRPPELGTHAALFSLYLLALGGRSSLGAQTPLASTAVTLPFLQVEEGSRGPSPQKFSSTSCSCRHGWGDSSPRASGVTLTGCESDTLIPSSPATLARSKLLLLDAVRRCLCSSSPGTSVLVLSLESWDEPGHRWGNRPGFVWFSCCQAGGQGSAALPEAVLTTVYCSADMEYLLEGALLWRQSHPDCGKGFSSPQRMLSVKSVTALELDPDTPRCLLGEKLGCARTSSTVPVPSHVWGTLC